MNPPTALTSYIPPLKGPAVQLKDAPEGTTTPPDAWAWHVGRAAAGDADALAQLYDGTVAEVDALHAVAGDLGLDAPPVAPAAALRARVLARAVAPPPDLPVYHFLTAEEGRWLSIAPGIFRKDLAPEPDGHSRSYLICMEPGAIGGVHTHAAVEHCLVVEGDFQTAGRILRAGDYHRAARGSTHAGNSTVGGCLVLIVEAEA